MVQEPAFPRGRAQAPPSSSTKKERKPKNKERDVLFGETSQLHQPKRKKTKHKLAAASTKSLLPIGGGACNLKLNSIEPLSFKNLSKNMKVLGVVREILDSVVVFSLPNSWTGYLMNDRSFVFERQQVLSVKITKLVSEHTSKDTVKRRIQVAVDPESLNNDVFIEKLQVRGIVQSVEDHGYLVDLGLNRQGFLHFEDSSKKEIQVNQIVDVIVKETSSASRGICKLALPAKSSLIQFPKTHHPTIYELQPGMWLDNVVVEQVFKNGLGVTFGGFRAAIEDTHVNNPELVYYKRHPSIKGCRVLAVDPTTKIIRLSILPHLTKLEAATFPVNVGDIIENAKVVRLDHGLGALLELPNDTEALDKNLVEGMDEDDDMEEEEPTKQLVYVHISKAMDDAGKTQESVFNKKFSVDSEHTVRILSTTNLVEGIMAGGTASNIVAAHVLTYDDLEPGQVFKQVPIVANLDNGNISVDFGMNIRGLLPANHLFDQITTADYRGRLQKVKYAVGAKVDVRVFQVDAEKKKCLVTAKKSLVKASNESVLKSYEDARVGKVYPGFISSVNNLGVGVTFFNKVFGRVTAKSLAVDMGVDNIQETYKVGDVVSCRVVHIKKKSKRKTRHEDDDEVEDDSHCYYELSLSLKVDDDAMETEEPDSKIKLQVGSVLPLKSLRVMEFVKGKKNKLAYTPGYAIVRTKTKYLVEQVTESMPEYIDCKLPYDHLLDAYNPEDIETVTDLDELGESLLTIGKKVNRKGLIWKDPKKSNFEYKSGTGALPVVSVKESLIEVAEAQAAAEAEDSEASIQLPGPDFHYYVGAKLRGTVGSLDARHGAFVRFLGGMSGLVPKRMGGLHLKLFSTVTVKVEAVDDKLLPPKILLGISKLSELKSPKRYTGEREVPNVGDVIQNAVIENVDPYQVYLRVRDDKWAKAFGVRFRLHCSMAKSDSLVPQVHPFYGLRKGSSLCDLRVVSVRGQGDSMTVDLTNLDESFPFVNDAEKLTAGDTVHGMISASSDRGLLLQISPRVKAHVPALEVSEDLDVLNNLAERFPVGRRLNCVVKHKKVRTASKDNKSNQKHEKVSEMLLLSLLDVGKSAKRAPKPKLGDIVVGRIDRLRAHVSASELGLDLRGGYTATCCITELADVDDWASYPLGEPKAKGQNGDISSDSTGDARFAHGRFVQCKVLGTSDTVVEVSLRPSRLRGDSSDDIEPQIGQSVQAYVIETNKKGCFLRLSRQIAGRTELKELSDHFLPNPAEIFRRGRLVVGKVKQIHKRKPKASGTKLFVDVDMRGSKFVDAAGTSLNFEGVEIGNKYKATVVKVEDYGVFVRLHNSDVSGLVHKSECSDNFVKNPADLYNVDDLVKVVVLKKDASKKQVGFSLKASHFDPDDESEDESSKDESPVRETLSKDQMDEADSDDENFGTKLATKIRDTEKRDDPDDYTSDESSESDSDSSDSATEGSADSDEEEDEALTSAGLDTNVGFDWNGRSGDPKIPKGEASDNSDSSDDDDDDENNIHQTSHKSRKKQAKRRQEEHEIARRETALADGTADENPETAADFERLLASQPSSSEIWIRFMAFHLGLANVSAAREVANRAFSRIEFRQEEERLNVWCALLTLELKYGSEDTLQQTLEKACQHNNPKYVYLRMCEILEKHAMNSTPSASQKTDEMFARMCKKFKSKKKVWIAYMEYLLKNGRHEEAYALSKRCLLSLKPHKHVNTMSRFAQLMFQYGNAEKARTIFEGLLAKYPKRLDLLFVYTDMETKFGEIDVARSLYQKVANANDDTLKLRLTDQKMKSFFKKWFAFEEAHGTAEMQDSVKASAKAYVEGTTA